MKQPISTHSITSGLDGAYFNRFSHFIKLLKGRGFRECGNGSFRQTYHRKGVVIKVPRNHSGTMDNLMESKAWKKYRSQKTPYGFPIAPCRLLPNGCLMMVAVEITYASPPWGHTIKINGTDHSISDGYQWGWYKGRGVVYDYAMDIPDRLDWEQELNFSGWWKTSWAYDKAKAWKAAHEVSGHRVG